MRKALLVGIDHYPAAPLSGCIDDATRMHSLLCRHHDQSPNFDCKKLLSSDGAITRAKLLGAIEELFRDETEIALLFFAGHGTFNNLGGFLVTPDAKKYAEGVSMAEAITLANNSHAREVVIILDCCHSGALGQIPAIDNDKALLRQGVSVLAACRASESALESSGGGLFTALVCDALDGGGSDVVGKVTVASVYAYVDQALGAWDQRPLFKAHVTTLVSLRNCPPAVPFEILRLLPGYFKKPGDEFKLDPSYEPDAEPHDEEHEKAFGHLQKFRAARLLVPVGEDHMYYAAMRSKSCKLTSLGKFCWHLANTGKI